MSNSLIDRVLRWIYPRRCKLCGDVVTLDEEVCELCASVKIIDGEICLKCGRDISKCECEKNKYSAPYKGFTAPYYFNGTMKKAVYRLKSSGYKELAPAMSEKIAYAVKLRFPEVEFDCVTYVPMTKSRQRKRGYNQAELLAAETAKCLSVEMKPLLVKTKDTQSQRLLSAQERSTNLHNAFEIAKNADVSGKTVLLIDDVKTTGSTLCECSAVLNTEGAKAVYAAAFTVTDKK